MRLSSNRELYDYLLWLAAALTDRGSAESGLLAKKATGHVFMRTEFIGESQIALRRILAEGQSVLKPLEAIDLKGVLQQLDHAMNRRP
jgi:hypothetical protein